MGALSFLNLILYAYVVFRAIRCFRGSRSPRREEDKVIVACIGMLSVLFVVAQAWMLITSTISPANWNARYAIMYLFCVSNGVLYLSIIDVIKGARRERHLCQKSKRYFP